MIRVSSLKGEIKQPDGYSCLACCAAMITGETLQDVFNFVGHDGSARDVRSEHPQEWEGFTNYDITMYLLHIGYWSGTKLEIHNGEMIKQGEPFNVEVSLEKKQAILVVKSKRFKNEVHAIYWDGHRIFDPNPDVVSNMMKLSDYELLNIVFVERFPMIELSMWKKRHSLK